MFSIGDVFNTFSRFVSLTIFQIHTQWKFPKLEKVLLIRKFGHELCHPLTDLIHKAIALTLLQAWHKKSGGQLRMWLAIVKVGLKIRNGIVNG